MLEFCEVVKKMLTKQSSSRSWSCSSSSRREEKNIVVITLTWQEVGSPYIHYIINPTNNLILIPDNLFLLILRGGIFFNPLNIN